MVPFAGWSMPVQYTSILDEHRAVRTHAGLFDVSHMGEAWVTGPDAARWLDRMMTHRFSDLAVGRARYTLLCQPDGGVVDDLIISRLAEDRFLLCLNASNTAKDLAWLQSHQKGYAVEVTDASDDFALLALQGPQAATILQTLTSFPLDTLPRLGVLEADVAKHALIISRTGYTGEDGFELFCPVDQAIALAEAVLAAGQPQGLVPVGLGARDSLRLEAGYPLYGHEISETINPLEAGLGWAIKWDKPEPFIGQEALATIKAEGPARRLIYFTLDDRRIARAETPVLCGDTVVGEVRSGTLSPLLNQPIGSALVQRSATGAFAVDLRGNRISLQVKKPPLHRPI
jgi:aminomethyltransferase